MNQNNQEKLIIMEMAVEPLLIFESYNLETLDRSWIKNVWDSSFTNIDNIPSDYLISLESQDINKLLNESYAKVKDWISQNDNLAQVSWQTLLSLNLDVQALMAILAYLIKRGLAFDASQDTRRSCLRATSLYFLLLSIPGSNAFQAFHPGLYEAALKTLTLTQRLSLPDPKTARKSNLDFPEEDFVVDDEDFRTPRSLPKSQSINLTKGLNGVVFEVVTMLKSASTSLDIRSLETTVFHLVELTKLANETMSDFSRAKNVPEVSINCLAYNAYVALGFLCNPKYATISVVTRLIGKYVLPQLSISGTNKLSPKQQAIIRDSTIHFIKTLLENHGVEAQEASLTLIQHLMIKSPERLEGRQKQAVVVVKLINICHGNLTVYKRCLKDLLLFSEHNKISCRIFAQEIIGRYLLDLSASENRTRDNDIQNDTWSSSDTEKLLLAAVLSRCVDSSSMVRGRAIATFAEFTDSTDNPRVRAIFRRAEETQRREGSAEMPNIEDLLAAIEDNDIDKVLPNFRGVIAMLKKRGQDERALVRRSSLQALRNGIFVVPELLEEAAPLLTTHCRDAALTVRKYAIRVLTTLLEKYPSNRILCNYWVDSVVPRVYDSETKVQEEVLDSLERLTVAKIVRTESPSGKMSADENLPWIILRELARNKMGDHLAKACSIWVNSGTINAATMANIKSHIGTENNLEAWLLLASLAENTPLGNMTNYYNYFEKALSDDSDEKAFLASVVLQVLRHCWPSFDDESLRKIQNDMTKYLKLYRVREALISHCLDILHGIEIFRSRLEVASGGEEEEAGDETMRQLTRLAEATITRIVEDGEDGENGEDQEESGKILLRATCTLGHASFLCTEKIGITSLRILQGFLLEWDSLPSGIRARKEIQGAAVTVLGQQALRDREIAQEMTPIFGRLLRNTSEISRNTNIANGAAVRINTAKALADICVRFTALVEPFLPDMCISMKDPDPQVRQVILVIFIQLLAEDFIKINGPFFFNILSMLGDSDETIRQMTVFLVKERLISKNKSLVTQQFINCIYHFNDYERRLPGISKGKRRAKELQALTIPGEKGAKERRLIYDFMLEHLDAPGKLTILVGLTSQIFKCRLGNSRTALGQLNVSTQKGICVFRDALYVLSSEYLHGSSCTRQNVMDEENFEDATGGTPAPPPSAASSLIVEAMKKHRLQIFLPGLVELKERFSRANSPLLLDVAKLISTLLTEYNKDQLENLYNEYPELEQQIERDIREFHEEEEKEEEEAEEEEEERIPEEERAENSLASSTPRKSKYDASEIVNNPQWMPRIVLRRISTLTYPEISQHSRERRTSSCLSESGSKSPNRPETLAKIDRRSSSPRVVLRRLEEETNSGGSGSRIESPNCNKKSDSRQRDRTFRSGQEILTRHRTRSSSIKD